jgi:ribonuclease HI
MVRQMNGEYKVRDKKLQKYNMAARMLLANASFKFSIVHIPREKNAEADSLANRGIDEHKV